MKQISDQVYQIPLGAVNAFLIVGEDLSLVDTGYRGNETKIFKALASIGKGPADVSRIILTHSHPDHAGALAAVKKASGAPVWMHHEDAELVRKGIAGRLPYQVSPGLVNKLVFRFFIKNLPNAVPQTDIEEEVRDGDVLPFAGGIRVLHTPGHSRGHICLLVENDSLLIAGDICANMMGLDLSTVYEDASLGLESIRKVSRLDFEKAGFGHGSAIRTGASSKLRKKF
jgi:glyoxylase-like metal-dependent hydrolase (beta-lactamase superfamily II)